MKNENENKAAKELFKVIAYSPAVSKATGSIKFAVLWGQIKYWSDKSRDPEGWVYKSSAELFDEIGMSRKESDTARALGEKLGVMKSKVAGTPPTVHYLINEDAMVELIEKYLKKNPPKKILVFKNHDLGPSIIPGNSNEVFILPVWMDEKVWREWIEYRKEKGKKLTNITIKKQIKFLEEHKENYAEIIMNSIRNGWQGLFEVKNKEKIKQREKFCRLHDGSKVELKFGKWVPVANPEARLDERYYPEIKGDLITEEEWQAGKRY